VGNQLHLGIGETAKPLSATWEDLMASLAKQASKPAFDGWLKEIRPISLEDGVLHIAVPSQFAKDWIEKRYALLIRSAFSDLLGKEVELRFSIQPPAKTASEGRAPAKAAPRQRFEQNGHFIPLIERYTFRSFVEGRSNRLAVAGTKAVAKQPGTAYNPLVLYGGVGLGKTHLMHAIGHEVLRTGKGQVAYVTGEMFTTEFVSAIRERRVEEFRRRYRNIDVLLLDDVQFIADKDRTEEEFFHTFNTLYQTQKQIVLCSDRAPKDLLSMDPRLRSRFECGLIADIKPPDLETRIAILQRKAEMENVILPENVALYVASLIESNVRTLEGALIKLLAYASLTEAAITEQLAREVLGKYFAEEKPARVSVDAVIKAVSKETGISTADLLAKKRSKELVQARQIAMYLARELTDSSLPDLGEKFGRDHSTVLHACKKIRAEMEDSAELAAIIASIKVRLKARG